MGKPGAFLTTDRQAHVLRPTDERTRDFDPLYREPGEDVRREQASRCMMCGVAFCQSGISFGRARTSGCPLHNLIPEWNELIYRGRMEAAAERLALTSPLPEFTSRVCPALCEAACNLGTVDGQPVTIHDNERAISDWEWEHGGPARFPAPGRNAPRVTVVGSGPAGLAAAWDLARRGARVTIVERDDRAGGLLMYGIPNMKLEKSIVQRRVDLMESLGIEFRLGVDASRADVAEGLLEESDAVILACGARTPRPLASPGADAAGVVYAVDYLEAATRAVLAGDTDSSVISARGLDVVVIGGGDTGNDCVGTAVRQGAQSVRQLEFLPEPPACPREGNGWPQWPNVKKTDGSKRPSNSWAPRCARGLPTRSRFSRTNGAACAGCSSPTSIGATAPPAVSRDPSMRSRHSWCSSPAGSPDRRRARSTPSARSSPTRGAP